MASRLAGIVDPTKPGEYPIVLSDALLGKSSSSASSSKEAFTGIRYNHKPAALSADSSSTARIRSSTNGVVDLAHEAGDGDDEGTYGFKGARSTKDGQYVLVFDPARRVFVLHRLDSMFHMNLTQTPDNDDAAALKDEYPHLEPLSIGSGKAGAATDKKGKDKPAPAARAGAKGKTGTAAGSKTSTPATKKKVEKKDAPKAAALPLPAPAPTPPLPTPAASKPAAEPAKDAKAKKPARRRLSDDESDSDDDGGLVLEYPEGKAPASAARVQRARNDFSPAFPIRRFSEFARGEGEEEEEETDYGREMGGAQAEEEQDADGEEDEEYEDLLDMDEPDHLKLPGPLNGQGQQQVGLGIGGVLAGGGGDDRDEDFDDELEAELEKQLMEDEDMAGEESEDVSEEE